MFSKRPRHRVFDYPPRFYKPEEDEQARRIRRLGFSRQRKFTRRKRNPVIWLVFIFVVIYIYLRLQGIV